MMQEASERTERSVPIPEMPEVKEQVQRVRGHLEELDTHWTTAAFFGVGWIIGRTVPLRAVLAVAGIGARAAMVAAVEHAVMERVRPRAAQTEEAPAGGGPER